MKTTKVIRTGVRQPLTVKRYYWPGLSGHGKYVLSGK